MQSFKLGLNGYKALFIWSADLAGSGAARCPLPTTSPPDLLQSQRASTAVAWRPPEVPGVERELPKAKPSLFAAAPSPARAPARRAAAALCSYCLKAKHRLLSPVPKGRLLGRGAESAGGGIQCWLPSPCASRARSG